MNWKGLKRSFKFDEQLWLREPQPPFSKKNPSQNEKDFCFCWPTPPTFHFGRARRTPFDYRSGQASRPCILQHQILCKKNPSQNEKDFCFCWPTRTRTLND